MRIGGRIAVVVLVSSALVGLGPNVSSAHADVQQAFQCPSAGAWDMYGGLLDTVANVNDDVAPTRSPGSLISVPAPGVRGNDERAAFDAVPGRFTAVLLQGPSHAKNFTFNGDGSYTWEPVDDYYGGDSFRYTYVAGTCVVDNATVTIPPATGGRLRDDSYTLLNDRLFTSPLVCSRSGCGVMRNDLNTSGLTIGRVTSDGYTTIVTFNQNIHSGTIPLTHGTLTITDGGSFTYAPANGFVGIDTFSYGAASSVASHDGWARVDLNIAAPPQSPPPYPRDDTASTDEDTPVTITTAQLRANDSDVVQVDRIVTQPSHGTLQQIHCIAGSPGCFDSSVPVSVIYTPDADYHGKDWFSYEGVGFGGSAFAWVEVTVNSVTDVPTANNDTFDVRAHVPTTLPVLANDHDPDGFFDPSTVGLTFVPPLHGTITRPGDGTFVYTADGTASEVDLEYRVSGPNTPLQTATLTIHVTPNPLLDDAYTTTEDTALHVAAPGVFANDDPHGTLSLFSPPQHGTLDLHDDGSFDYTPDRNFTGTDSFIYAAEVSADAATVSIDVQPVNDPPVVALNSACVGTPQAPCLDHPDNRGNLNEGDTAQLRGYITDPEKNPGTLVVDWGDGQQTSAPYPCAPDAATCPYSMTADWPTTPILGCNVGLCNALLFFDFSHVYGSNPPEGTPQQFPITVTATESGVGGLSGTANGNAVVHDLPPSLVLGRDCSVGICSGNYSLLTQAIGGSVVVGGKVSDPGVDTGRLQIDWGDGTTDSLPLQCSGNDVCPATPLQQGCLTLSALPPSCGGFGFTHQYADASGGPTSYPITVTATTDVDPSDTVSPGQTASASATAIVVLRPDPNAPIANAGSDITVDSHRTFLLDASASHDPQNEPLTYHWEQIDGPLAVIQDPSKARIKVRAPFGPATLHFRVTATDASGHHGTDDVTVTVRPK